MFSFRDRAEAGRRLAGELGKTNWPDPVVVALPRGGVPVAEKVAHRLRAPLDVLVVRKIGAPGQPEYAVGAVTDGGRAHVYLDEDVLGKLGLRPEELTEEIAQQHARVQQQERDFRREAPTISLRDRDVIVVDDGLATGSTAQAAIARVRREKPRQIILAVPVAPPETLERLRPFVDAIVCLETPANFQSVGQYYDDFNQVSDQEVMALLN